VGISLMKSVGRELQPLLTVGALGGLTDGQLLERFVSRREAAAFEVLVHRHGPMVWGICRRLLFDRHDAEDAFQVTFLVLVRKAGSIAQRDLLANWLYGVAYQTARKARAMRGKQRSREKQVVELSEPEATPQRSRDDAASLLDRELSGLPEKYRIPIVLCELEGKGHKEAAQQLGWPVGTLSGRLSRGRVLLAKRLARRGVAPLGGVLAVLSSQGASAAAPNALTVLTTQGATAIVTRGTAASSVSAEVAALLKGVLNHMLLSKLKTAVAALLVLTAFGTGIRGLLPRASAQAPAPAVQEESPAPPETESAPPKPDQEALQGTWQAVALELNGELADARAQAQARTRYTIKGSQWLNGQGGEAAVTLDPTKTPKEIDIVATGGLGVEKGVTYRGIYQIKGDVLKLCLNGGNMERPREFTTKPGTPLKVLILNREKSQPANATP